MSRLIFVLFPGPKYWSKQYPACSEARQSPIEIQHEGAEPDSSLTSFYFEGYNHTRNHENFTVWNDGYTGTYVWKKLYELLCSCDQDIDYNIARNELSLHNYNIARIERSSHTSGGT